MSKRAGHYVTVKELVDEVGVDAVRFVFLTKSHDTPLDFDIDLVKRHDSDNPVYYVQYAHARICSIFRKAASVGISPPERPNQILNRLVLDEEMALIRLTAEFEPLLEDICRRFEPHRLTYYLTELASSFHKYFNLGTKNPEKRIVKTQDIFLRKRASERQVKTMDLSNRRVISFATHALVPGDLDGLDQPAIALSAPSVTGDNEDGLLTMGEVLKLKLNADWVVLSACNTGAA